jgi:hypothetical protein
MHGVFVTFVRGGKFKSSIRKGIWKEFMRIRRGEIGNTVTLEVQRMGNFEINSCNSERYRKTRKPSENSEANEGGGGGGIWG